MVSGIARHPLLQTEEQRTTLNSIMEKLCAVIQDTIFLNSILYYSTQLLDENDYK